MAGVNTRLVHAGARDDDHGGAVAMPIFQSSTYRYAGGGGPHGIQYIRYNNTPNQRVLADRLASLHGAEAGLMTGSGMAAVTATLLALHSSGDHILMLDSLYGATQEFAGQDLARWGIGFTAIPLDAPDVWEGLVRPSTRSIYVESLTNPLLRVPDHDAVIALARRHGLTAIIDNTIATAMSFRPLEHGYDLIIESCSKYVGGHSDLVAGTVLGSGDRVEEIRRFLNHHGGSLDPFAAYLALRGLTTMRLRLARQWETAGRLAAWLETRGEVARVHHPGLASHPDHERAGWYLGARAPMIGFEPHAAPEQIDRALTALALVTVAPSFGGPETLVTRPAATVHSGLSAAERAVSGISDSLLRLSVGLEDFEDLQADLSSLLAGLGTTPSLADVRPARPPGARARQAR